LSFLSSLIFVSYNKDAYVSLFELFILTFVLSTISQIGDISISYFKRKSNLKNSGKIIPGHGGLLDRIDGMIFAVPTFYFINFITNINL
jgi:phosphatidate cytidylyltransferase